MKTLTVAIVDQQMESRRFISAIEDERARIARELHDDIAQRVAVSAIELRLLYDHIPATEAELRAHVLNVYGQLAQLSNDVGSLSHRLHPSIVRHLGVAAAIESECDNFAKLSGRPVHFKCQRHLGNLPESTALTLFRIAQEALRNVAKHAPKARVQVTLERINRNVRLCVEDDGGGFDPEHCCPGLGMVSMRERTKLAGGGLTIHSSPGNGARVEAFIPLASRID